MAGDFFGPTRQFQIIGKARAIVERMTSVNISNKSCILFSQYTREVIRTKDTVEEIGTIERTGLEDLRVFVFYPSVH